MGSITSTVLEEWLGLWTVGVLLAIASKFIYANVVLRPLSASRSVFCVAEQLTSLVVHDLPVFICLSLMKQGPETLWLFVLIGSRICLLAPRLHVASRKGTPNLNVDAASEVAAMVLAYIVALALLV